MEEIEERRFNRILKVAFTEAEKVDMVGAAGSAYRDLKKAQDDLATVKAQFQSKIKEHEAEISSLFERINTGWEMQSVACREVKDFATGSVIVFRDDTEEMIEERAMTAEERQPALPFKEKEPEAGVLVDADFFTPATAQADAQSEAGERMAALDKPLDIPPGPEGKDWNV